MITKDYYAILGVSITESPSGIREAFRDLVKRYHPDRIGQQGTPVFQDIMEAYEVLSDPEQRRHYNQGLRPAEGDVALWPPPIMSNRWLQPDSSVPGPMSVLRGFQEIHPSVEALFDRFLRNFTGLGVPKGERVEALQVEIILTPDEATHGVIIPLGIPVFSPCPVCGGSGSAWLFPCTYCREQGVVEDEKTVRISIPPLVRDGTIMQAPIQGLGIHNFYLHLSIRIAA
jgi:DnaJ-class molecular chaperone